MRRFIVRVLTTGLLFQSLSANALEFTFSGRTPSTVSGRPVQVVDGVEPGVPVLFDASSQERTVLRPAREDETSTNTRPIYRFEWESKDLAHFYELVDPSISKELTEQNARDTASPEGKAYELKVIDAYFAHGKVFETCLPPSKPFHGTITAFIVVTEKGKQQKVVLLPEGSVAECIAKAAESRTYPTPPGRFTAKASVRVTK